MWGYMRKNELRNHEKSPKIAPKAWKMRSGSRLGGDTHPWISKIFKKACILHSPAPQMRSGSRLIAKRGPFRLHFRRHFRWESCFLASFFTLNFEMHFLWFLIDFSCFLTSFSWLFRCQKVVKPEKAESWKTYVLLREIDVFKDSSHHFYHEKL